jgi:3-oxoacyl-[acyl-carrier-protein] synthase II
MLGGFITIQHNLRGPNLSDVTACAASTHGISNAFKTIALGGADKMLVVGAESAICGAGVGGFAAMKALSTRNDDPKTASRPFDKNRDGFVMGEGAGALVLETLESAQARGAKIYAEIIGFGESGDANHITAPTMDGPLRAMKAAFAMAERTTGEVPKIDYVNAHGTSTPVGDKNETAAIKELFGGKENCPPVTSTKGQHGHCLGAAGAIEAIITIKAMNEGIIPPTINQEESDENCDLDYVPGTAREAELNTVMSNNFGFGGTNGVVIMRKFKA